MSYMNLKARILQEIADGVCGNLPEGFIVHLCMEKGSTWVVLTDNQSGCLLHDIDGTDKTLYNQLNEAVEKAGGNR